MAAKFASFMQLQKSEFQNYYQKLGYIWKLQIDGKKLISQKMENAVGEGARHWLADPHHQDLQRQYQDVIQAVIKASDLRDSYTHNKLLFHTY